MRVSPRTTGLVACALMLAVSLGPKVVLAMSPATAQRPLTAAAIAAEIERSGFRVVGTHDPRGLVGVEARSGACGILVTRAAPQGWNRTILREIAGTMPMVYLYDGERYDDQPVLRTSLRFYWELLKRRSGLPGRMPGVFALAWSADCGSPPVLDLSALAE